MINTDLIVNDVTKINPVAVKAIITPTTIEEIQNAVKDSPVPVSVGGGRFSMGGQTASPDSLHIDMRTFNQIVQFSKDEKWVRVQAGIRWRDLQKFIDAHDLSIKIMQTYSNFTVGGALSVNCHGRYIGLGPLILSVRSIRVILANGDIVDASPTSNSEVFFAACGGYNSIGIIAEVELDLADNVAVERCAQRMPITSYLEFFKKNIRDDKEVVFHNADIYPPHYTRVNAVSWKKTKDTVTVPHRLIPEGKRYHEWQYFMWAITETPFGAWRREHIVDPILFAKKKVEWRNYEASYDVAELRPPSFLRSKVYVLQEYFVPLENFDSFVPKIAEILRRHKVKVVNISIRHALPDPGSKLAWAREEVFAFVLYYKQNTNDVERNRVSVWTRELIDAVLSVGGAYYLPYQPHARDDQFHAAYPKANELFELKKKYDPKFKFRNVLWDKYYKPQLENTMDRNNPSSEFHAVFNDEISRDNFYRFLQVVFNVYPEDRFHKLIIDACKHLKTDEEIYRYIQQNLPRIKPLLGDLTYALPALFTQKKEMTRQTLELLGGSAAINGCIEIGSTGRYVSELKREIPVTGDIICVNEFAPQYSPLDIVDRRQIKFLGRFSLLNNYQPLDPNLIQANSYDLVTCYIGLHHVPLDHLDSFVRSIHRVLRPGGTFILRDHDVRTPEMHVFVSLVHAVFNAGTNVTWDTNAKELRLFKSIDFWTAYLAERGFKDNGHRLLQKNDPSDNTLMSFTKVSNT